MAKPNIRVKTDKYIVDVCYGGLIALFPDSTLRQFETMADAEAAIRIDCRRKAAKKVLHVAIIEWNARDKEVEETIQWHSKKLEAW